MLLTYTDKQSQPFIITDCWQISFSQTLNSPWILWRKKRRAASCRYTQWTRSSRASRTGWLAQTVASCSPQRGLWLGTRRRSTAALLRSSPASIAVKTSRESQTWRRTWTRYTLGRNFPVLTVNESSPTGVVWTYTLKRRTRRQWPSKRHIISQSERELLTSSNRVIIKTETIGFKPVPV